MNKQLISLFTISCLFILITVSCEKKVGKPPAAPSACDSITYAKHIQPLVNSKCLTCHVSGGQSPDLSSYSGMKDILNNGKLKLRVVDGPNFMPPTGALPQNEREMVQCWINNGGKE